MTNWLTLNEAQQLDDIVALSHDVPCLIFKHSTRCPISSAAKHRIEGSWEFSDTEIMPYYLDLIRYRSISDQIATQFEVYHESPQVLLIKNGECIYDESHLDINVEDLKACLLELA